jgi:hypothetical protein
MTLNEDGSQETLLLPGVGISNLDSLYIVFSRGHAAVFERLGYISLGRALTRRVQSSVQSGTYAVDLGATSHLST